MGHSPLVAHKTHLFAKKATACVSCIGKTMVVFSHFPNCSIIMVNYGLIFFLIQGAMKLILISSIQKGEIR